MTTAQKYAAVQSAIANLSTDDQSLIGMVISRAWFNAMRQPQKRARAVKDVEHVSRVLGVRAI